MKQIFHLLGFVLTLLVSTNTYAQTTYYSKAAATNFNDPNSWGTNPDGTGFAPGSISNADFFIIQNTAALTLSADATVGKLTLTTGSLSVAANTLTITRATGYNATFLINGGTFNGTGGNIVLNGNLSVTSGNFNQSAGTITIDGNDNNVAASSVPSGTHLCALGGTLNCSGGSIVVVDPPVNTYAVQTVRSVTVSTAASNTAFSGTHTVVLGDGVSTTPGNTDGFVIETFSSGRVPLQNVTVNAGSAAGRWGSTSFGNSTSWGTHIKGTLTINAGSEFTVNKNSTSVNEFMIGSIVNDGIFTTGRTTATPVLNIGAHASVTGYVPTVASTISGTGVFRNLATSPTAQYASLNINNILGANFSAGSLALGTYQGNVSGTLNMIAGAINTNGQEFILGVATGTPGSLSFTSGGFTSGSTFGRWFGASTVGTTITASSAPTTGGGTFPFIAGTSIRTFHLNRPTTTSAIGGVIKVQYTDGAGLATIPAVLDGAYSVDKQSNAAWTVTAGPTFSAGTGTFTYAINGQGIYTPLNTNGRLLKSGILVGTHQTGTNLPIVQRSAIGAADFQGTFNVGLSSLDIPTQTVQSGAWEDPATWGGAVPTCGTTAISTGHVVTVSASTTGTCGNLTIAATGSLLVTGGVLTVGCTNNNTSFVNSGTLNVSGGTLNVNGNLNSVAASNFTQSGGTINIDGNSATIGTSVLTGTALVALATSNLNWTGGTLVIVDPHRGTGTETAITYTAGVNVNATAGHTLQFGDGVSTTAAGGTSGFRILPGGKLLFGNLTVNTLSGAYPYQSSTFGILGNLTITAGEFQAQNSGNIHVNGNIINNGILTTSGTLALDNFTNATAVATTTPQTISGTGIYKNAATSTANFASLLINNNSAAGVTFADVNSLLSGANTGTVSGTLTITAGNISTGANAFVLGTAVGTVGALSHTAGGFTSGSTFTKWFPTAAGGTTITAAAVPSVSTTGAFQFVTTTGVNRTLFLQQTAAATLGGKISVVYNANGGGTSVSTIADLAYNVETLSNESWTVSTTGITGTPTYTLALSANSLYGAVNGNSRVTLAAAPAAGTHQNGTSLPHAQRLAIPLASLANTYHIGAANSDIPFQSVASGAWDNTATWNKGTVPACTDAVFIGSGHNVTVSTPSNCKTATTNTGATLTISAGADLTVGCTLNNNTLTNNGTLTITGGIIRTNGNVVIAAGSTFNQSGGEFIVDGNAGGVIANSVLTGTNIFRINSNLLNWTGGKITLVDPHAGTGSTDYVFAYNTSSLHYSAGVNHTIQFGDGISTDPAGNANGFFFYPWFGTGYITFGNMIVDAPTGTNRIVKSASTFGVLGDFTINQGEYQLTGTLYCSKNITNNGLLMTSGVLSLGKWTNAVASATADAQSIGGTGTFTNATTGVSGNLQQMLVNNTSAGGVTLNVPLSVTSTLTMTAGIIHTTATNLLTLGSTTTSATLNGTPSATNMVDGPIARTFASARTASGTYNTTTLYPVGSGTTYLPIWIDPSTSAAASTISAQAFNSNAGTFGSGVIGLAPVRWEYNNAAPNMTNAFIRVSHTGIVNGKALVQATSAAGQYDGIVGVTSTVAAPNLTSSAIPVATLTGFLSYGDLQPCIAPTDQATTLAFAPIATTTLTGTYVAATSTPTGYLVVRYPAAAAVTNPVNGTLYISGVALGAGTVAYIGSALTFNQTGLNANTTYKFYIYTYNNNACFGPTYNTTNPLNNTVTTCASTTAAPTSSAGTAVSATGFTANWTASTTVGVTDQYLEVSTSSTYATLLAGYPLNVPVGTTSVIVTGLNASTTYYYRVRANVGICASANSTSQTVVTDCIAITAIPHTQDFATFLPTCWKNVGEGGTPATGPTVTTTGSWAVDGFLNVGGTGATKVNIYSNIKKSWLISPEFDLTTGAYLLKYRVGLTAWNGTTAATLGSDDEVQILGSTDNGVTWTSLKTYNASTPISNTGTLESIDISALNTATVRIAFWVNEGTIDDSPDNDFFIDDFSIEIPPACDVPTTLAVNNITATTADLSWTAPTLGTTPAGYNWEVRSSGAGGSGATGLVVFGNSTSNLATATGLTPNSALSLYVQTDCGTGATSTWAGPINFTTLCAAATIPLVVDFEGATTLQNCWTSAFVSGTRAFSIGTTTSAAGTSPNPAAQQGTNRLLFPSYAGLGDQTRLISPPIDANAVPSIDVNFQWYESVTGGATSYLTEGVQVQYSYDAINWTDVGTLHRRYGATTGWFAKKETIIGSVPQIFIGFLFTSNAGYDSYLDAVNIDTTPPCVAPSALATTIVNGTDASFSWIAPALGTTPTGYNWEVRTSGVGGSGTTGLITGASSATTSASTAVNTLLPQTTYSLYVQTDCGAGSSSTWVGPFTFTTPCAAAIAPTVMEDFTTYVPNCWKEATGALTGSTVVTGTTSAWAAEAGFANTGTNPAVRINLYSTKSDWLISNPIDLGATGGFLLKYNMAVTSYLGTAVQTTLGSHKVDIVVSTDAGATWSSANIVKTYTGVGTYSNTGQIETIDISSYTGIIRIGFLATTTLTTPDIDFHVDNLSIELPPACSSPTALMSTLITSTGADLSWAAPSLGGTPVGYNWEVRTSGAGGSGVTGLVTSGTVSTTSANVTALLAQTTYSFYVQTDCGAGSSSTWAGPFTFTTPCNAIGTFPWSEGFEGITTVGTTEFPPCWLKQNGDWRSADATTNTLNDPRTGTKYITNAWNAVNEWMWTPTFQLTAGTQYNFKFWYVGDGDNGWTGEVGYSNNQNGTAATILGAPFITNTTTSSTSYQEVVNSFTPTVSGDYSFGIRINANGVPFYLGFDDFSMEEVPVCTGTPVPGITSSSAGSSLCINETTALSVSGTFTGTVTYQWQTSPDNINWSDIVGANSTSYLTTVTSTAWYRMQAICAAASTFAYSTGIEVALKPTNLCYCVPLSSGGACIENVTIATINNTTSATCAAPYYSNQVATTDLTRGSNQDLSVTTSTAGIISVWIDYNQNGTFEASEWQQVTTASTAGAPSTITINVPSTATLGLTGMRIRSRGTGSPNTATDACTQFFSGECEDYLVTIVDASFVSVDVKVFFDADPTASGSLTQYYAITAGAGFPSADPYAVAPYGGCATCRYTHVNNSTIATAPAAVLAQTGATGIVDWVFLELRTGTSGATTVVQTKAALLQVNGKIVEADGTSPVKFNGVTPGNYYVAIRHRNHLGFRTDVAQALSSTTPLMDFTNNSIVAYGVSPLKPHPAASTIMIMNGGDSSFDGSIDSSDSAIWETQNGSFDDYTLNADYNQDGSIDGVDSAIWELNNGKYEELD